MNTKMICFGAMALSMVAGSALDDPAKMQPFYTDSTMKKMRSNDEFIKAWKALTPEDQKMVMAACDDEAKNANPTNAHPEFCSSVKQNGGSK